MEIGVFDEFSEIGYAVLVCTFSIRCASFVVVYDVYHTIRHSIGQYVTIGALSPVGAVIEYVIRSIIAGVGAVSVVPTNKAMTLFESFNDERVFFG